MADKFVNHPVAGSIQLGGLEVERMSRPAWEPIPETEISTGKKTFPCGYRKPIKQDGILPHTGCRLCRWATLPLSGSYIVGWRRDHDPVADSR